MGTLSEEIFSFKLGCAVAQGETVVADVDRVMSHDTTTPLAIQAFRIRNLSSAQTFASEPLGPFVARIVAARGIIAYIRQEETLR